MFFWLWIILGLTLIGVEFLVPGFVVIFLGVSALLVALGIEIGWIDTLLEATGSWVGMSLALMLLLRRLCLRYFPADTEQGNMDEDLEAFGSAVPVLEVNDQDPRKCRISYRGSSWDAECLERPLTVGESVRLLYRDELVWVVEPDTGDLLEPDLQQHI